MNLTVSTTTVPANEIKTDDLIELFDSLWLVLSSALSELKECGPYVTIMCKPYQIDESCYFYKDLPATRINVPSETSIRTHCITIAN